MSKDKKKKDKDKDAKKGKKHGSSASLRKASKKATKSLQTLSQNPMVADVVAAALVGMASALKDSKKARRLASDASDQLNAMSKNAGRNGGVMWDLALEVGRSVLDTLAGEAESRAKGKRAR